ncbi:MAG TPA: hypothetical protein VKE74_12520 [Gemmataceae bacterium]|nr:hypothetical protein [Gemmataceae bacterium]
MPAWLERAAPSELGVFLGTVASPRKSGLFMRHLCRCFPQVFTDPRSLAGLDAADRYEAGEIDNGALNAALVDASIAANEAQDAWSVRRDDVQAAATARATDLVRQILRNGHYRSALADLRFAVLCRAGGRNPPRKNPIAPVMRPLFFEFFGDIERTVALDPAWLTSTVVQLAEGIYADRAFDRLPILADALQDAGCENPEILAHCRGPSPHARGCWVVDLLLGKS